MVCAFPDLEGLVDDKLATLLALAHTVAGISEVVAHVRSLLLSNRDIFNMKNIGIKGIVIDISTSESLPSAAENVK